MKICNNRLVKAFFLMDREGAASDFSVRFFPLLEEIALMRILTLLFTLAFSMVHGTMTAAPTSSPSPAPTSTATATFGGGCFWCVDAVYQYVPGVLKITSGYAGGTVPNPTYDQVCTGRTGHAEVVQISYDPSKVSYDQLLDLFWKAHDPTTLNRQGADHGTQYRSIILTSSPEEAAAAEASKKKAQALFSDPIVTEIVPLTTFYPAEEYHQDYYQNNKDKNPYCRAVIAPKLKKLGLPQ
jgi:peptide-methionine (S)-S-oxide reductase